MISDIKSIVVDPRCRYNYSSYFLLGLDRLNVPWKFGMLKCFELLMVNHSQYNKGLALFVNIKNGNCRKIYIDFDDPEDLLESAYEWCDLYAKVNFKEYLKRDKVIPIGPYCGLRIYGYLKTLCLLLCNIIKVYAYKGGYKPSIKVMVRDYLYTLIRRLPYSAYTIEYPILEDYCFAMSTLWYDDASDKGVNNYRYIFTRLCSRIFKKFEGGFFFVSGAEKEWSKYSSYLEKYKGLIYHKRIPPKDYVERTKKSVVVFNTPSVSSCFGWKLSEYFMMGKAIISTPLCNVMPTEFVPGKHYILAETESDIEIAIKKLKNDNSYRTELEKNVKAYYEKYLAPENMMGRILQKAIN